MFLCFLCLFVYIVALIRSVSIFSFLYKLIAGLRLGISLLCLLASFALSPYYLAKIWHFSFFSLCIFFTLFHFFPLEMPRMHSVSIFHKNLVECMMLLGFLCLVFRIVGNNWRPLIFICCLSLIPLECCSKTCRKREFSSFPLSLCFHCCPNTWRFFFPLFAYTFCSPNRWRFFVAFLICCRKHVELLCFLCLFVFIAAITRTKHVPFLFSFGNLFALLH